MSKLSFALSSLIAVVPAGFLMYLLILGFIDGMPTMLMVAAGLAAVCALGVVLLPVMGFLMISSPEKAPAAGASAAPDQAVEDFEDFGEEAEGEELGGDDFEDVSYGDDLETFHGEEMEGDDEFGDLDELKTDDEWDDFDEEKT